MLGAYATSKTTMIGMAKAMAGQLAENNIRINCIAPGLIKTNFSQAVSIVTSRNILKKFVGKWWIKVRLLGVIPRKVFLA